MDDSLLAAAAFALGVAGNAVKALPQFVRTAVRGRVAGLAPTAVWLAFTNNVLWLCFGLAIGDRRFVVLSAAATALTGATLGRFAARTGHGPNAGRARLFLPGCALFAGLALLRQGLLLESVGTALGVAIGLPQLVHLWRSRHTAIDVSGVAQGEYAVVTAAQLGWTVYWLTQGHPVAAAGAAWGGLARAATLGMLRAQVSRSRGPR